MAFAVTEELLLLIVQPIFLLLFSITIWSLQSFFITGVSRRFIFPSFYRNSITTYLIAQVSIILHEMSHFLSAIFTGSSVISEGTFVTPTRGRVTAASEESIVGWFSRMIAALAPSFIPPVLFLLIFFLVSGQNPEVITKFSYPTTFYNFQTMLINSFNNTLIPDAYLFISSITNFTNPLTFVFIYFLIICSVAAGPSEGDWKSTLDLFLSPIPIITLLASFLFFNLAFSQFNISFVIPLVILISFIFFVVIVGIFYSFLFAQLIAITYEKGAIVIVLLVLFFSIYYSVYYLSQNAISSFVCSIIPTMILSLFIKIRKENKNNKRTGRII